VHVTDVLKRYTRVLETIHRSDWQAANAPEHLTSAEDATVIHDGFAGADRARVMDDMRSAHTTLVEGVKAEPAEWFERKADVTYAGSTTPYPTSPSDVIDWVRDHYAEHTQQVTDLVSVWAATTR
jgi:hypothetical protein